MLRLFDSLKPLYHIWFYTQTGKYTERMFIMKKMFKRSLAAVMAVASLAVGMVGIAANASEDPYTSTFGSESYGSCFYYLTVNSDCKARGSVTNYGTTTRYCTVELYLASSVTATPVSGSNQKGACDLSNGNTLTVSKAQSGHGSNRHCYKAQLYGGTVGPVPIVETKYLNLAN